MSFFDIGVFFLVGYLVIVSILKGMIKTVFSLIAYVGGCFTGYIYKKDLAVYIGNYADYPKATEIIAFFIIFITTTIFIKLVGGFIQKFMHEKVELSFLDRFLGGILGGALGILIIAVVLIPIEFFPKLEQQVTQSSVLTPYLKQVSFFLKENLFTNETIKKNVNKLGLDTFNKSIKDFNLSQGPQPDLPLSKDLPNEKNIPQDNYSNASKKALKELLMDIQK